MKPLIYTIIEYQSFGADEIATALDDKIKAQKFFQALEDFQKSSEDNSKFLKHSSKTKLKAQNYVGIIQTPYGTLEILPKCFRGDTFTQNKKSTSQTNQTEEEKKKELDQKAEIKKNKQEHKKELAEFYNIEIFQQQFDSNDKQNQQDEKQETIIESFKRIDTPQKSAQRFLIHCLTSLKDTPFKQSQISSIDTCNTPLLDVFMQMFCQELLEVCKKGIRHDYVAIEENRPYLKGKLLFGGQIRHNLVHKERFYTSSDEYITDIASNRLIKSTLELIAFKATSHTTLTLINQCLEIFEEIPSSGNIEGDFLSCTSSRHFSYYDNLLEWCKLFLQGNSFSAYSGENKAYTLLFPMEKLFESYVAHMLKKSNPNATIHAQNSSQHLLYTKNNSPLFKLKPDLLFEIKEKEGKEKRKIVADTKWKPLKNAEDKKHGIAQSDLYQVFAYAHYHQAQEVWLIYPKLYEQNDREEGEIKKIIDNLKEWNAQEHYYCHPCAFKETLKHHKIELKIFFAPLAFH
ncbi:McrC family protein [uncultured Helicobacter sp.]|uniref:McrC family protein n=1 Tax=uncultured Helicobacter sp. TaxID=175537 RepID=UPI002612B1A8|nr:McrC family protein [uncultured Helicobacter sp.]